MIWGKEGDIESSNKKLKIENVDKDGGLGKTNPKLKVPGQEGNMGQRHIMEQTYQKKELAAYLRFSNWENNTMWLRNLVN